MVVLCYLLFSLAEVTVSVTCCGGGGKMRRRRRGREEDGRLRLKSEMKEDMKWKEAEEVEGGWKEEGGGKNKTRKDGAKL